MALILDICNTREYANILGNVILTARKDFYNLMLKTPEERKKFFVDLVSTNIRAEIVSAWTQIPNGLPECNADNIDEYWEAINEEQRKSTEEIVETIANQAMLDFARELQLVVDRLTMTQAAVSVAPAPTPAPAPAPAAAAPAYPAPDAQSMALDPVNDKGVEIPPLQTRNLYTIPRHERAQLMPKTSVDADDNSWLNNSVYNRGD